MFPWKIILIPVRFEFVDEFDLLDGSGTIAPHCGAGDKTVGEVRRGVSVRSGDSMLEGRQGLEEDTGLREHGFIVGAFDVVSRYFSSLRTEERPYELKRR